jgi:hypothetical protein
VIVGGATLIPNSNKVISTLKFEKGDIFEANNLGSDTTLNLRSGPGVTHNVIGKIPLRGDVIILPPPRGYFDDPRPKWGIVHLLNNATIKNDQGQYEEVELVWYYVLAQVKDEKTKYKVGWCTAGINENGREQWLHYKGDHQHDIME